MDWGDLDAKSIMGIATVVGAIGIGLVAGAAKVWGLVASKTPIALPNAEATVPLGRVLDRLHDAHERVTRELEASRDECRRDNEQCERRVGSLEARLETMERLLMAPR